MAETSTSTAARRMRLAAVDGDLADRLGPQLGRLAVTVRSLPPGPWAGPRPGCGLGLLVADGVLAHTTRLAGHRSMLIVWAGDIVTPPGTPPAFAAGAMGWEVVEPALVAELDARFMALVCRSRDALAAVLERVGSVHCRSVVCTAVSQLPRVEERLLGVLLMLAEERGRMTPDGLAVDAFLTHERLGELIGAARPTVSLAFADLRRRGLVTVHGQRWVIARHAARELAEPAAAAG